MLMHNLNFESNQSSTPLVSWDKIVDPSEGGLGIRKNKNVNAAMVAKLGQKILTEPNNVWVKVVSAKYLNNLNFLEAKKTDRASNMRKYILVRRYLINKRICWVLGNGNRINFWHDIQTKNLSLINKIPQEV